MCHVSVFNGGSAAYIPTQGQLVMKKSYYMATLRECLSNPPPPPLEDYNDFVAAHNIIHCMCSKIEAASL